MVPFRMRRRCPKVWWPLPVIRKHWLTVGDPAREFTMTQSAPLMVLPDPDEFVVVQVK
ncbi:phage major head protein [Escherichia coli]|uniref:Phage major head protein n=1 Tax=Escherichia coli TaxID=562 RepID=A0A447XVP8_ECOLX|nr:phage major head protein [Escherichia coli]